MIFYDFVQYSTGTFFSTLQVLVDRYIHYMSNETNTEENNNRKVGRIIAIIVAVLVIAALIVGGMKKKTDTATDTTAALPEGCKPGFLFSETTGKPCPQTETGADAYKADEGMVNTSGYEAAIRQYAGKVVIFDGACKPISMISGTIAPGTRILVANNSEKQLALSVAGKSATLDAYHYFTTTLRTTGDTSITCDSKSAATITVK
jgi:hypothetical protein